MLRAQLIEEGLEVEAYETAEEAPASLAATEALPSLLVAGISADEDPATATQRLAARASQVAIWVIASRLSPARGELNRCGAERAFLRPEDMGELVEQIKQRVEKEW